MKKLITFILSLRWENKVIKYKIRGVSLMLTKELLTNQIKRNSYEKYIYKIIFIEILVKYKCLSFYL